jgi:diamine N-acetyltransferase
MREKSLTLTIRRATEKDDAVIAKFGKKAFETAFGPENDPEDMRIYQDDAFSLTQIAQERMDPATTFLLAYHNKVLMGYAKLQGGQPPDCVLDNHAVEFSRLYIRSQDIGKGFGSQLIQACADESWRRGYKTAWLGVWEKNVRAHRLYERLGFLKVGTKTFVVGTDIQHDVVYARSLENTQL